MEKSNLKPVLKHANQIANNINIYYKGSGMLSHVDVNDFDLNGIASLTIEANGSKYLSFSSITTLPVYTGFVLSLKRGDLVLMAPPISINCCHAVPASEDSPRNVTMQWRRWMK